MEEDFCCIVKPSTLLFISIDKKLSVEHNFTIISILTNIQKNKTLARTI